MIVEKKGREFVEREETNYLKYNAHSLTFGMLILALILVPALLVTKTPTTETRYFSDRALSTFGDWRTLNLFGRYTEGHATFTPNKGASAVINLGEAKYVTNIAIRFYAYNGPQTNAVTVTAGKYSKRIVYGGGPPGVTVSSVEFDPPSDARKITILAEKIGTGTVLIDGVVVGFAEPGFDLPRFVLNAALIAMFILSVWLAVKFTKGPPVSSGRVYLSVDMLRGVGASLVLLLHATGYAGQPQLAAFPFLNRLSQNGHFGVEIFYVVSAFTLTFSISSALRHGRPGIVQDFWRRRVLRIMPVFAMTFIMCLVLSAAFSIPKSLVTLENVGSVLFRYATMSYFFDKEILI
ncbi:acyltransferase family protein, partial [Luminiphilus sp.]|nr:acyltransferase family protein [Luminiphilus sp.]